jgi:lactate dehydrogenase-like 2-hydroxyacid dehydrogenase
MPAHNPPLPSTVQIVRLDAIHFENPSFSSTIGPHTLSFTSHALTTPTELHSRISTAHVILTTRVFLTASSLSVEVSPNLRLIGVMAAGTDVLDATARKVCKDRGIGVVFVPHASAESVAEHALSLFLAARRRIVVADRVLRESASDSKEDEGAGGDKGVWVKNGSCVPEVFGGREKRHVPLGFRDEVAGIVGVGELGNRIAAMCKALGMGVLLAERKGVVMEQVREGRVPFEEVLRRASAVFVCCPLMEETRGLISTAELATMRPEAIIVNISRGGIVDEVALASALERGQIAGAATDVFAVEPAWEGNSPLVKLAKGGGAAADKVVMSPHVAWFGGSSIERLRGITSESVRSWVAGEEGWRQNEVVL